MKTASQKFHYPMYLDSQPTNLESGLNCSSYKRSAAVRLIIGAIISEFHRKNSSCCTHKEDPSPTGIYQRSNQQPEQYHAAPTTKEQRSETRSRKKKSQKIGDNSGREYEQWQIHECEGRWNHWHLSTSGSSRNSLKNSARVILKLNDESS